MTWSITLLQERVAQFLCGTRSRGAAALQEGDVICHQGEFGSTAFYIEQGRVDIFLESRPQPTAGAAGSGVTGWLRRLTGRAGRAQEEAQPARVPGRRCAPWP